ncbi:MAG: TonB-dependent receptor [Rudaea sp.]|uniref:TonB-dependent receptor n=1 Tax=Rudaea sp. TaxID=2136325 RepID=UPI0039E65764
MKTEALLLAGLTLTAISTAVAAQDAGTENNSAAKVAADNTAADKQATGLADVVVTAERHEASVQKTALSVTAIAGDTLANDGIGNIKDLITSVPGLSVTQATPNANLSLLGITSGGGNAYADPSVSFNIGGVNIGRQYGTSAAFYDLARVEVLKGPQGTLYGRNATVGAVNLIPARPVFETQGDVGIEVGSYDLFKATGMFNTPLSDQLALRAAFQTNKHDGYLSNGYNDADTQAGRLSALYEPNDKLSVLVSADYFHDGSRGQGTIFLYPLNTTDKYQFSNDPWFAYSPAGCGDVTICPTFANSGKGNVSSTSVVANKSVVGNDGYIDNTQLILSSEIVVKFDFADLTIIPAYVHTKVDFDNYSTGFEQIVDNDVEQYSLEARLSSNGEGPLKWVAGLYYYDEAQDNTGMFLEPAGYQTIRNPDLTDRSFAAFGQATYSLTDRFRLTGGLRYTREKKTQDGYVILDDYQCSDAAIAAGAVVMPVSSTLTSGGCKIPNAGTLTFSNVSGKVGAEFDVGAHSLLYANASTGFKAGGFFAGLPDNTYKPEKLIAYEIGSKNRFLDNKLQANLNVFYWDYRDQQISVRLPINPGGTTGRPVNANGNLYGSELDLVFAPTSDDRFSADVLFEKGKNYEFPVKSTLTLYDLDRLNLPEYSVTLGYDHTFHLGNGGFLIPRFTSHYESDTWLQAQHLLGSHRNAYHLSNFELTYMTPNSALRVTAYVDNMENVAVLYTGTSGGISGGLTYSPTNVNSLYAAIGAPRTYGLRLNYVF